MTKLKTGKSTAKQADIYQDVTNRIVIALENGTIPWRKPWKNADKSPIAGLPFNPTTGNPYSGINVLLLWIATADNGYQSNRWMTYRQAQAAGGQVRKGEKSTQAVVYKDWKKKKEDLNGCPVLDRNGEPVMETIPMLKPLQLFNAEQCDGLPEEMSSAESVIRYTPSSSVSIQVHQILENSGVLYRQRPQNRAYYSPGSDMIVMPMAEQFETETDYLSTLLHEMVHSTGHQTRLNRDGITGRIKKGSPEYAFEELIAEVGNAFLCSQLNVFGETQHESYIAGWLKVLKSDKKALFRACARAREASEFLLTVQKNRAVAA